MLSQNKLSLTRITHSLHMMCSSHIILKETWESYPIYATCIIIIVFLWLVRDDKVFFFNNLFQLSNSWSVFKRKPFLEDFPNVRCKTISQFHHKNVYIRVISFFFFFFFYWSFLSNATIEILFIFFFQNKFPSFHFLMYNLMLEKIHSLLRSEKITELLCIF